MKKIPLLSQIILIYSIIFALMTGLGYFLLIPAIETPYVQETYKEINYQLNEYVSSGVISDRRYVYVTLPSSGSVSFDGSNSMVLRSQTITDFALSAMASSSLEGNGYLDIDNQDKEILYGFQKDVDALYLVAMIGEAHPISGNPVLMTQIIGIILLVFFLPIIFILIWSILVARSIRSLNQQLGKQKNHRSVFVISKEIESLDQALTHYQKEMAQNAQEKQELFQNISHELKTPITTIQSYSEGIEDGLFKGQELNKAALVIQSETQKLLGSLNQIMELNRWSYLKQQESIGEEKSTHLQRFLPLLLSSYQTKYPKVTFELVLEEDEFKGNEKTWTTVFTNIFENNIRHGATTITISGDNKKLGIANDGEKIPENLLTRLFTPFVKGEKGSYGLGLTIIKTALELQGYSIHIKNQDQGVTYFIEKMD